MTEKNTPTKPQDPPMIDRTLPTPVPREGPEMRTGNSRPAFLNPPEEMCEGEILLIRRESGP
jgi:hypothetical protein